MATLIYVLNYEFVTKKLGIGWDITMTVGKQFFAKLGLGTISTSDRL